MAEQWKSGSDLVFAIGIRSEDRVSKHRSVVYACIA